MAIAEKLLALFWLVVVLLSGILVSATEMSVSFVPSRMKSIRRIAGMTGNSSLNSQTSGLWCRNLEWVDLLTLPYK
jgi:hypothetical protein